VCRLYRTYLSETHLFNTFEPKGCDRNRVKHYPAAFERLKHQLNDFRRDIFNSIFTTNNDDKSKFYLPDGMQDTIWKGSGIKDLDEETGKSLGLVEVPVLMKDKDNKCQVDICVLTNLCLLLKLYLQL
jgi:hypothetical protein